MQNDHSNIFIAARVCWHKSHSYATSEVGFGQPVCLLRSMKLFALDC